MATKEKFQRGQRVRVAKEMPRDRAVFDCDCDAVVQYSDLEHSGDGKDYSLFLLEPYNFFAAWYPEDLLTLLDASTEEGIKLLEANEADWDKPRT